MANAQLWGMQQFFYSVGTNIGQVLAGGKIYFYVAGGTLTPQSAYTSSAGSAGSSYPNPLTLDSGGFASISSTRLGIWLQGFYRIQVYDANGVLQFDWDQVSAGDATVTGAQTISIPFINTANMINNSEFQLWSYNPSTITAVSDTANFADGPWYSLSQSNPVSYTAQTTGTDAQTAYAALQTQSNASAQRMGIAQFTSVVTVPPTIGNTVFGQMAVKSSTTQTMGIALLCGVGVTDSTVDTDLVNNWSSSTYTQTNFFTSSGSVALIAVNAAVSVTANTTSLLSISGTIPSNSTGLYLFVWTVNTNASGATVQYSRAAVYESPNALNWRPPNASLDNAQSLWKTVSNAYQASPISGQTVTTTPSLYQTAIGYLNAGIAWVKSGFLSSWTIATLTASRTIALPDSNINVWIAGHAQTQTSSVVNTTTTCGLTTAVLTTNTASTGMFVTYTATKSSNPIRIRGVACVGCNSAASLVVAVFQSGNAVALGTFPISLINANTVAPCAFDLVMASGAGDTSSHTYTAYFGSSNGTNVYFNADSSNITYNGTITSSMELIEYTS